MIPSKLLLAVAISLHVGVVSPGPRSVIDPITQLSPSGEWRFHVNPNDRFGLGPSMAHLEHRINGEWKTAWRKQLPFTLSSMGVTNAGLVAGCSRGSDSPEDTRGDFLWMGVYDLAGEIIWSKEKEIGLGGYLDSYGPSWSQATLGTEPERLLVNVHDREQNGGNRWQSFGLYDGVDSLEFRPSPPFSEVVDNFEILQRLVAIPGTNLWVGLWSYGKESRTENYGLGASVMTSTGKRIWSKSWEAGHKRPFNEQVLHGLSPWVEKHGLRFDPRTPGGFSVLDVASKRYAKFITIEDREVLDVGYMPADLEPPTVADWTKVELQLQSRCLLGAGQIPDFDRDLFMSNGVTVDFGVGINTYVYSYALGTVQVFDALGAHKFELSPGLDGNREFESMGCMDDAQGNIYVSLIEPEEPDDAPDDWWPPAFDFALFSGDGLRLGIETFPQSDIRILPSGESVWQIDGYMLSVERVDSDGRQLARIDRNPKGQWFKGILSSAMDNRGELSFRESRMRDIRLPSESIFTYGVKGELTSTIAVGGIRGNVVAASEDWVLLDDSGQAPYIANKVTGKIIQAILPGAVESHSSLVYGLSHDGQSLLAVSRDTLKYWQYALPD